MNKFGVNKFCSIMNGEARVEGKGNEAQAKDVVWEKIEQFHWSLFHGAKHLAPAIDKLRLTGKKANGLFFCQC